MELPSNAPTMLERKAAELAAADRALQQQQQQRQQPQEGQPPPAPSGGGRRRRRLFVSNQSSSFATRVCRQYIYDRVSGNSYVPRTQRGGGGGRRRNDMSGSFPHATNTSPSNKEEEEVEESEGSIQKQAFAEAEEDNQEGEPDDPEPNHPIDEDPTDCRNRPPHFLCYVPPCVRRCPGFMEQNACCQCLGQVGCHAMFKNHHTARRRIFAVGFTFNFAALCLTIVASMAFSTNFKLLTHTSFSRGDITVPSWNNSTGATIDIGFRAVAFTDPSNVVGGDVVSSFDEFCETDKPQDSIKRFLSNDLCGECKESSQQFVLTCIINIIIIVPNMFSDISRMYPNYDLNCPNFYGSLMATVSVFLGLWTISTYQQRCFENVEQELRPFYRNNFTAVPSDQEPNDTVDPSDLLLVRIEWSNGPGLDCLWASTLLRLVDALCNYIVPTPSITRDRKQQEDYELEFGEPPKYRNNNHAEDDPVDEYLLLEREARRIPTHSVTSSSSATNHKSSSNVVFDSRVYGMDDDDDDVNGELGLDEQDDQQEDDDDDQEGFHPESEMTSFHQIRPPWDRRGLPCIVEESENSRLSLYSNPESSLGSYK